MFWRLAGLMQFEREPPESDLSGGLFLSFVLQKSIMGSQVLLKMAAQSGGFVNVIVHIST